MHPPLRFKQQDGTPFPEWEEVTLGDIGRFRSCPRLYHKQTTEQGPIPVFKIGTLGKKPDAYISRELYEKLKATGPYPHKGAILLSVAGTIGRVAQYHGEEAYFESQHIVWLEHNDTVLDDFLRHFYSATKWPQSEGSVVGFLSHKALEGIKFAHPAKEEQIKIADLLNTVDTIAEHGAKELTFMLQYKRTLWHKLLHQELRCKTNTGAPYPKWSTKATPELCARLIGGATPDPSNESYYQGRTPWISTSSLDQGDIFTVRKSKFITDEAIARSGTKKVKAGSIAVVLRVGVGKVALLKHTTCTSQDFVCLEEPRGDPTFIAYLLAKRMQEEAHYAQGTSIKGITLKSFREMRHKMPASQEEQHQIAMCLQAMDRIITLPKAEHAAWQQLKRGLLQLLFA